ncbi:LolA family protein [Streptomyces iconiensis]|uniref:DUF2092 domain-containing protein n=1 Tax=Streptomyces iconiensis TaxID=1384038 RepID=A0ABT6ZXD3_9ACTN|nr:DUF2092 domain-containing protein [Streptomyces iconiensis]MDJ1133732.1 DUF2092 domain-containing protein [Streptomyces iconiensis]
MAQIQPRKTRSKAVRYGVPAAVAGVAALTVGLVPALASTGNPDLPKISAEKLVAKMAASDVQHMSGTVKINTDLGLPSIPGSGSGGGGFGGGPGAGSGAEDGSGGKKDSGSAASPDSKLMELASGEHTLRFAADGPDKQRLSVMEDAAEYSLIHNDRDVWGFDSGTNSAWHAKAPRDAKGKAPGTDHEKMPDSVTPQKAAEQALKAVGKSTSVSVEGTAKIAGRDAYQLVIKPKGAPDTTVESIRIAVDADNGVPLKFTLTPKEGDKPAIDIAYAKVDFGKPSAGTFDFKPPKGTKVTEAKPHAKPGGKAFDGKKHDGKKFDGEKPGLSGLAGLDIVNKGASDWNKVASFDTGMPGGIGGKNGPAGKEGEAGKGGDRAEKLLDGLTDEVKGDFGTGRVVSTRLVNALMTDDGKVYVGAVTKDGLVKAANADSK